MISLVLPYWERQAAADAALRSIAACYQGLDLEVIVVDDGSPQPFVVPDVPLNIKLVRLPEKTEPKNPCGPLNAGVAAARGDYIALSCVEILHRKPVLSDMALNLGRWGYATAACTCEGRWHAHSSLLPLVAEGVTIPSSFHFLAMLHRDLWEASRGFDDDYREGYAYEDADFLLRVKRAGARFDMRDDLVVEHQRKGARAAWTHAMHERNRQIFRSKWC